MHWLDTTLLTLLGLGALIGAWTGFVFQIARLVGLSLAVYATAEFNTAVSQYIRAYVLQGADDRLCRALAYIAVFLAVLLAFHYLMRVLRRGVKAAELEAFDRLIGSLVGTAKMALILATIMLGIANYNHPATRSWFEESYIAPVLAEGMEVVLLAVPEDITAPIQENLRGIVQVAQNPAPAEAPAKVAPAE